jgi:hypothetical protein
MEVENALETLASTVTTLPKGIILLNATWFTEAVTTIRLLCLRAAILAARSIRANNSPPNIFPMGLVSLGKTKSVIIVADSLGVLDVIFNIFFAKIPNYKKMQGEKSYRIKEVYSFFEIHGLIAQKTNFPN